MLVFAIPAHFASLRRLPRKCCFTVHPVCEQSFAGNSLEGNSGHPSRAAAFGRFLFKAFAFIGVFFCGRRGSLFIGIDSGSFEPADSCKHLVGFFIHGEGREQFANTFTVRRGQLPAPSFPFRLVSFTQVLALYCPVLRRFAIEKSAFALAKLPRQR